MSSITQNITHQYKEISTYHNNNIMKKITQLVKIANQIKGSPAIDGLISELHNSNGSRSLIKTQIDKLLEDKSPSTNLTLDSMIKEYTNLTSAVDAIGAKITTLRNQPRVEAFELETPAPAKGENNQKNCLLM